MADPALILQIAASEGLVSGEQLQALRSSLAQPSDRAVCHALVSKGFVDAWEWLQAVARAFALEAIDLKSVDWPSAPAELLEERWARRFKVFPLGLQGEVLRLAIADPLGDVDMVSHMIGRPVEPLLAHEETVMEAIRIGYDPNAVAPGSRIARESAALADAVTVSVPKVEIEGGLEGEDDAPIVRLVQMIIAEAVRVRASDIHLEPLEERFRVRYRVDGELQEVPNPPPKRLQLPVISRIKVMGKMSIAEKRLPQDGRIQVRVDGTDYDLRVSSLPTAYGESVVMRILDKSSLMMGLSELGFLADDKEVFERLINLPDGILLVTGPTGSGKTTTLYSCLNCINKPDRKIITVEDPIEYQMAGINQVPVKKDVGMSFAAALKAILRQAPNIIMIGEIRDLETAEIAINASLTGHMVLSTLHTNDAPSAVTRLVDIGVKPYLVATSLRAALAQRLVRRICPKCRSAYEPTPHELRSIGMEGLSMKGATFMRGAGCEDCRQQGFRGRFGVFELLRMNEELERLIYLGGTASQLRYQAKLLGMRSMREDGIRKVMAGLTTVEEVLSVTVGEALSL